MWRAKYRHVSCVLVRFLGCARVVFLILCGCPGVRGWAGPKSGPSHSCSGVSNYTDKWLRNASTYHVPPCGVMQYTHTANTQPEPHTYTHQASRYYSNNSLYVHNRGARRSRSAAPYKARHHLCPAGAPAWYQTTHTMCSYLKARRRCGLSGGTPDVFVLVTSCGAGNAVIGS